MSFSWSSARRIGRAYRQGETTPLALVERALGVLAELDRGQPPLRAFISLHPDDVLSAALASTRRFKEGRPLGPLDGVPVAVKDEYDVLGYRTTSGTLFLGRHPAAQDALAVARLRSQGAVIFGKTNMYELGMSPSGLNPHYGSVRNPYDVERDSGGSSAGSAAAVASGIVPIALGNDGGGSLRIPAALCGVAAIKPSYGRVPTEGVRLVCWSLEHSGPMGATVDDVVLGLEGMLDERLDLPRLGRPLMGRDGPLRLGISEHWWREAEPALARSAHAAVRRLEMAGAELREIQLPHIDLALPVGIATFSVEGAAALEPFLAAGQPMSLPVRIAFDVARGISAVAFVQAQRVRRLIARDFAAALDGVDVILTPTTATAAPRYRPGSEREGGIDERKTYALVAFTFPQNLTGLPAAQVPCGYDEDGLPIGLQVIGRLGDDELTLAVAREVELASERRSPRLWRPLVEDSTGEESSPSPGLLI